MQLKQLQASDACQMSQKSQELDGLRELGRTSRWPELRFSTNIYHHILAEGHSQNQ